MMRLTEDVIRTRIAKRVAELLPNDGVVNLGVGIPSLAVDYLPMNKRVYIQTENGMLDVGPTPDVIKPNLINASRKHVSELPGSSYFDSATSFAMIRSGRLDATVIGALQISQNADLANWCIPGKDVLGPGGAMDLVSGVKEVIVATQHTSKDGSPKIIPECNMPLTAAGAVDTIVTEYALFRFVDGRLVLMEHTADIGLAELERITTAEYVISDSLVVREV